MAKTNVSKDTALTINSKVFYPSHGAGVIKAEKIIEFQGQQKRYYEFELIDSPLTISTPVENVQGLGIRPVLAVSKIKSLIKTLKGASDIKPVSTEYNQIIQEIEKLDREGTVESCIRVIQLCNFVKEERNTEGRLIPVSISKYAKNAISHITEEIAVSDSISLEKAQVVFNTTTGLSI